MPLGRASWLGSIALAASLAIGCARPSPAPTTGPFDVPPQALASSSRPPEPVATLGDGAPEVAAVRIVFRVLDQEFRQDPKSGRETYHTTLDVVAMTTPPQRLAIGTLQEPGCRLAHDAGEIDLGPRVTGGLVCYHAGYGDYVRVLDEGGGRLSVTTYGQSEALIGDENPPHEHARVVGKLVLPPGTRAVLELAERDAGILP